MAKHGSLEWMKQQRKEVKFSIPEREEHEDDITTNQLSYIKKLAPDVDVNEMKKLGKWQASSLIDQLKEAKAEYTEELIEEGIHSKNRGCLGSILMFILFITVTVMMLIF